MSNSFNCTAVSFKFSLLFRSFYCFNSVSPVSLLLWSLYCFLETNSSYKDCTVSSAVVIDMPTLVHMPAYIVLLRKKQRKTKETKENKHEKQIKRIQILAAICDIRCFWLFMQCFYCFCNLVGTTTTSMTCWPATAEAGKKNRNLFAKLIGQKDCILVSFILCTKSLLLWAKMRRLKYL